MLAIFLGGLSAGYWGFGALTQRLVQRSRVSGRPPPLLWLYAGVEAGIGVYALLFPWLFRAAQEVSLWLPTGGGLLGFAADVGLAAALIGPPAVAMGGTIPVLTQALARDLQDATRLHALVYAANTLGATAGALAAGFALVPWLGLDGVARAMGVVNLCAGAGFAALGVRRQEAADLERTAVAVAISGAPGDARVYAAAALLVGFAAMAFQTVLIRVGGLALGSSEFTFSMVVATFVFAIAVGSLAVSAAPRIGRAVLPATLWAVLAAFVWLYLRMDEAPYWAHVLRSFFRSHAESFHVYYGAAFLAILAVVGPAVALSGAVLPLLFDAVREEMGDLGARAGRLYSQNTIGSLLGALLGGYALLFWLDLDDVYRIALCALALAAAAVSARRLARGRLAALAGMLGAAGLVVATLPGWDASRLARGLFRTRDVKPWTYAGPDAVPGLDIVFHDDDPTASVAVRLGGEESLSIVVNGKSDGNTHGDRYTMGLAALVPALLAERAERAFVIGFGTGMTAGYLAELDEMRRVTVAEISSGVLRAAPLFDFSNFGASAHPKIELVRSDAYRALRRSDERYDVIVSEPSNPWVAGTEMLFSREFLREARDRLAPGGVYVQWYHGYENSHESVQLVTQTYTEVFDHVAVWYPQSSDLLLLGALEPGRLSDLERLAARAARPDFARLLAELGIRTLPELLVHEGVPDGVLAAARPPAAPVHTLYHPRLSYQAGRGFFGGRRAGLPFTGYGEPARRGAQTALLRRYLELRAGEASAPVWDVAIDHACRAKLPHCASLVSAWATGAPIEAVAERLAGLRRAAGRSLRVDLLPLLRFFHGDASRAHAAAGAPGRLERHTDAYRDLYYHALPFSPAQLVAMWERCQADAAPSVPSCEQGLAQARGLARGLLPEAWSPGVASGR